MGYNEIGESKEPITQGGYIMELAKITSKGQITIPVDIRKRLGVKEGDKVLFVEENGRIIMMNASMQALLEAQLGMAGAAAGTTVAGAAAV